MWCFILAQLTADTAALSGNAGWAGAGLLGAVLMWLLLWHLPAKDKQLKEMIDGKDGMIRELTKEYTLALEASRKEFREWLQHIAANDQANIKALTEAIGRDMVGLHNAIKTLKEQ